MKNNNNFSNELVKNLKKKAVRKYALIILVAIISISAVLGLNIEDKDSKLPDGQGNIITNEVVLDKDNNNIEEDKNISSNQETENAVVDKDKETVGDSDVQEQPLANNSISVDKPSTDKDTIINKPSANGNNTTNKPVSGSDAAVNKPSADKNTTTSKPSADKNTTTSKPSADKNTTTSKPSADKNTTTSKPSADKNTTTSKPQADKKPSAEDLAVDNSKDPTASNGGNSAYKPDDAENVTVTISIRCDTLSSDMSKLTNDSIKDYIPSNGVILKTTTYKGTTDNTVFDVLNTVCRNNGIHLESSYTPMYESYYVEGINYIYEFDGGPGSGWMYKVNGWYPNYGCSSYYLSDGDIIEWVYTCDYGVDVGGTLH